jgi:hypothetical protein
VKPTSKSVLTTQPIEILTARVKWLAKEIPEMSSELALSRRELKRRKKPKRATA